MANTPMLIIIGLYFYYMKYQKFEENNFPRAINFLSKNKVLYNSQYYFRKE